MRSANDQLREHIAREAARIMVVSGSRDFQGAKRKAAERLGAARRQLPRNREIEAAIVAYQQLFQGHSQPTALEHMRRVARDVMDFLSPFHPYLVGSVLSGTADQNSDVQIHLYFEPSEDIGRFLQRHRIRLRLGQRRFRFAAEETRVFPVYRYHAQEVPVELVVFAYRDRANPPLSPIDGRPMRRAALSRVKRLAAAASTRDRVTG